MRFGALIVAAGMSSRMGDFKPMLNIGSISIAERIIATFQQSGINNIVMVTGYNATTLERHLSNKGIIFLRNEDYEHTQMFDSAKIGLEYLKSRCDKIFFTPVDIPLFTSSTVRALQQSSSELACPTYNGETGHPLLISASAVDALLSARGEGGLQGAIKRSGKELAPIEVDDKGILHDADTPEEYEALLRYHNEQLVHPYINVGLAREKTFLDGRIAMLLRLVDETASVRTACQRMQISYSSGWNIIRTMESQMSYALLERTQGGAKGGESHLTAEGRRLLFLFDLFEEEVREKVNEAYEKFFEGVF